MHLHPERAICFASCPIVKSYADSRVLVTDLQSTSRSEQ
jgi:hypothetical protein